MRVDNYNINLCPQKPAFENKSPVYYGFYGISFGAKLNRDTLQLSKKAGKKVLNFKEYKQIEKQKKISEQISENQRKINRALKKFRHFSPEEYSNLSQQEKKLLRLEYVRMICNESSNFHRKAEKLHDTVSDDIKTKLDQTYGEGKYKVIIIGRSLSSIGKVLGYKIGEENVINIPLSNAAEYQSKKTLKTLEENGEISKFREFLKKLGLEKKEIKKSDKQYVIMDYCYSGKSLDGATKLLTQNSLLGKKNITPMDVMDCVYDFTTRAQLNSALRFCHYKDYAFVDNLYTLSCAEKSVKDTSKAKQERKLTWFTLLDNQMIKKPETRKEKKLSLKDSLKLKFTSKFNKLINRTTLAICDYFS